MEEKTQEKIKGIKITSVYDEKKFKGEVNDQGSDTVTTGYIPIDEQVKMIIRGQITIGNLDLGFENADDDIEKASPEEYFEDSVDIGSLYQDDVRNAVTETLQKASGTTSEPEEIDKAFKNDVAESANEVEQTKQQSA